MVKPERPTSQFYAKQIVFAKTPKKNLWFIIRLTKWRRDIIVKQLPPRLCRVGKIGIYVASKHISPYRCFDADLEFHFIMSGFEIPVTSSKGA
jgi:hypothetical protein